MYMLPIVSVAVYAHAVQPSGSALWDGTEHVLDTYRTVSTCDAPHLILKYCTKSKFDVQLLDIVGNRKSH